MTAKTLMIQGTGSSVGKSLLVAALCRIFSRRGLRVAPFKSQNMALNSFITHEGHEIGRAQAVQAEAAGLAPSALMNPVLLKPCGDKSSQVIVGGTVLATMTALEYYGFRHTLIPEVQEAFQTLAAGHDLIILEGAGSPAEINLRENDIANMGAARMANAPVLLVGDIDRGGVFAALYGTIKLLEPDEQRRIKGMIVNKFRGQVSILEPGLRQIEYILARPVLGVLPYWDIRIDEEDSLAERLAPKRGDARGANGGNAPPDLDIAVIRLPRLANLSDFSVFDLFEDVALRYVGAAVELGQPDLIILPGSKSTVGDLAFLRESGLERAILQGHGAGVPLVGLCGGFQMLGRAIRDPQAVESGQGECRGLGLLDMETHFAPEKLTRQSRLTVCGRAARGLLYGTEGMELTGYEIHMGASVSANNHALPLDAADERAALGAVNSEGTVVGSYVHGFFDNTAFTRALLNNLRRARGLPPLPAPEKSYAQTRQEEYDRLADIVEACLDMKVLEAIIDQGA